MSTFLYVLLGLFMFGVIIFIHELGHFVCAKAFHVAIEEFAIGMGPKILSRVGKDGVRYSLRLIPMGGFVSMVGEDEDSENPGALCRKPVWQRMIIVAAGAIMNLLLGFVLMGFAVGFSPKLYSTTISGFNIVDETGAPVETEEFLGLRVGDTLEKIGSRSIHVRSDFVYEVMFLKNTPVDVTVRRDGKSTVLHDVSFPTRAESGVTFGNAAFIQTAELSKNAPEVLRQSFFGSLSTIRVLWTSLLNTVKGEYGTDAISGPVGVIGEVKETVSVGWDAFLFLVVMLTMNIGMVNLMPLPALDGGRLFFMLIELIRRKPINPKYEGYVHAAGLVLLMGLMIFITYNDIVRIFFK